MLYKFKIFMFITIFSIALVGCGNIETNSTSPNLPNTTSIAITDTNLTTTNTQYNVVFKNYDGSVLKTEIVEQGSDAIPPENPERPGFVFQKWATDFSNVKSNLTIYPLFECIYNYQISDDKSSVIITGLNLKNWVNINIPEEISQIPVRYIQTEAFKDVKTILTVNIPRTIQGIDDSAFSGCTNLESFNVDNDNLNFTSLDGVLYNKDMTELYKYPEGKQGNSFTVPSTIKTLKTDSLSNTILSTINLPDNLESIQGYALSENKFLKTVDIPYTVTEIRAGVFSGDIALTNIDLPGSIPVISDALFSGCVSLISINIPNGIQEICQYAFYEDSNLKTINIPQSVSEINMSAFFYDTSLTNILVDESNSVYKSIDGVLFSNDGSVLYECPEGFENTTYTVPEGVQIIYPLAFSNCTSIHTVVLPDGLKEIRLKSFLNCTNLETIIIPNSVESIESQAFNLCDNVTIYTYASSIPQNWAEDWVDSGTDVVWGYSE